MAVTYNKASIERIHAFSLKHQTIMIKIYKRRFLAAVALMISSITATYAYDFRVDGIYYNITSDTEVEVTIGVRRRLCIQATLLFLRV